MFWVHPDTCRREILADAESVERAIVGLQAAIKGFLAETTLARDPSDRQRI